MYPFYLSIVAIFRNEGRFLKEWIEYHKLLGIDHFYLADNNSTDDSKMVIQPYIDQGLVEYVEWPYDFITTENLARNEALKLGQSQWLAVIDIDEYLVPKQGQSLKSWLQDREIYPAITINWQMFGTSQIEEIPTSQLMIETLTRKAPWDHPINTHIKSIIQTPYTHEIVNPHYGHYHENRFAVNSHGEIVIGPWNQIVIDEIQINHYCYHDLKFLREEKIPRTLTYAPEVMLDVDDKDREYSQIEDHSIQPFIAPLRQVMFPTYP